MQEYIAEKFLQPEKEVKPPWTGWKKKPDLSRLITIEPSHFCDGFEATIEKIKFGNFQNCYNLVSLDLSSLCNLKEIGDFTFQNAEKLREIKLPPSLECISLGSFENCTSLVRLDLSNLCNLQDIKCDFFKNAWSLREIAFPPGIIQINTRSFTHSTSLTRLDFSNCEQLGEIGFDTFVRSWSLREIIFPPSLKKISAGSFLECTSLKQLDLSHCDQFEEFGNNVFTDAFSMEEVIFPPNLPKITNHSFRNCTSLVRLRIPASVKEIEVNAFNGCINLKQVIFEGDTKVDANAFQNCPRLAQPKRYPGFRYGKYSELKGTLQFEQGENGICGITLEGFEDDPDDKDPDIVILPCGHPFREEALHEWILRRNICPTCKVIVQ